MKKVLILAYDFPPYVSVGALRPYSWFRYLGESGIYPVVITRQWGNKHGNQLDYISPGESDNTIIEKTEFGTIIRTPYKPNLANRLQLKYGSGRFSAIRKLVTGYYEIAQFLFVTGTKSGLYKGAKEYLKNEKTDIIIASGSPHILFKYASKLSRKTGIPWIADYRDPWSQSKSRNKNFVLKNFNSFFEKRFLKNCSAVTTVSEFLIYQIQSLVDKPFHIITNGFDPENCRQEAELKQNGDIFTLAFAGSIYAWHPLISVLSSLNKLAENPSVKFCLQITGTNKNNEIKRLAETRFTHLKDKIQIYGKTPNRELMARLAKANALLLFNDYILAGTKIFDYLSLQRQIVLCYRSDMFGDSFTRPYADRITPGQFPNLQENIISETQSGVIARDPEHFESIITQCIEQHKIHGEIKISSKNTEIYSRQHQTQKLATIIHKILEEKSSEKSNI